MIGLNLSVVLNFASLSEIMLDCNASRLNTFPSDIGDVFLGVGCLLKLMHPELAQFFGMQLSKIFMVFSSMV